MITSKTKKFFSDLSNNNNREWFHANKDTYDKIREEFILFIEDLLIQLKKLDRTLENLEAKKCIFRINRDIRFTKDKSPYKENIGAFFSFEGKKTKHAGYYFHIDAKRCFVAGGLYMPDADILKKIRYAIHSQSKEFLSIINKKNFVSHFDSLDMSDNHSLVRPPKGYQDADEKILPYLKLKSFTCGSEIKNYINNPVLVHEATKTFTSMMPLIHFFNAAIIK